MLGTLGRFALLPHVYLTQMTAVEVEDVRKYIVNECLLEAMPSKQYGLIWRRHGFFHPRFMDLMENTILGSRDPDLLHPCVLISMGTGMVTIMTLMIGTPMNAVTDVVINPVLHDRGEY